MAALGMLASAASGKSDDEGESEDGGETPPAGGMEGAAEAGSDKLTALEQKVEKLEREKADAERRARRSALLEASGLRAADITDRFRQDVLEAESDEIAKERIADRKRLAFHQVGSQQRYRTHVVESSNSSATVTLKSPDDFRSQLAS